MLMHSAGYSQGHQRLSAGLDSPTAATEPRHEPEILGDAEMILALDATVDQSRIVACGAIDDPIVAEAA